MDSPPPPGDNNLHPDLLARLPRLAGRVPWLNIGRWPTPVRKLERLGRRAGAELWLKQDGPSGPGYGGNKVRKLEPLLAQARARGAARVLTVGGIGSNHVVACAVHAGAAGLGLRAVVVPQPVTPHVRQVLELARALGVELLPCPSRLQVPLHLARAARRDPAAYPMGPGGSSPLGTLGFVAGALELAAQVRRGELPCPHEIYVPLGSGGTLAGLALGLRLAGLPCRAVGVRVVERPLANRATVRLLVWRAGGLLRGLARCREVPRRAPVELVHGFAGPRYGQVTDAGLRARRLARELEGLELETTYSAKALAALLARAPGSRRRLLFWNTHNSLDLAPLLARGPGRPLPAAVAAWLDSK